jgi:hypothetical protein
MRFLIDNYSTHDTTEPYYLNATLGNLDGCFSTVWYRDRISAYDIFDMIKPDFFIAEKNSISMDAIKYIHENKNIGIIINVTGFTNDKLLNLE